MKKQIRRPRFSPYKIVSLVLSFGLLALIIGLVLRRQSFPVLQAAGPVAAGQQQLLIKAFLLMLLIVIPVFVLTFSFAWRYRESNKATYKPNWDHSRFAESVWWLVPTFLIVALSVMTWHGTFQLDPYKPLAASDKTLNVQVVALDWRWLFIYPDQQIASINELRLPVNTAVKFDITADAPMNSFWIPQLGGQIYAMPGMGTKLNLRADKIGSYHGSSANISGEGFAGMDFKTIVTNQTDFDSWTAKAGRGDKLTHERYTALAEPSQDKTVSYFSRPDHGLYGDIIGKYMGVDHHGNALDHDDSAADHAMTSEQHEHMEHE